MRPRPGFALLLAMLLTLALSGLAMAMLAVASWEATLFGALRSNAALQRRAEGGARAAFARWSTAEHADLPIGASASFTDPDPSLMGVEVHVERLGPELFLLRARAEDAAARGAGPVPGDEVVAAATAGLLVRVLDPARVETAFPAAATAEIQAELRGGAVLGADACPSAAADAAGVRSPAIELGAAAIVFGHPPVSEQPAPPFERPHPLEGPLLAMLADVRRAGGTVMPRPLDDDGTCGPGPSAWGAIMPEHRCHDLRPVVAVDGDLVLAGGEARAVLVVTGDLLLTGDVRLTGVVVVGGELRIDRAEIRGVVRAARVTVDDGVVRFDSCARRDLLTAPALDRAFRPPGRWWVPVF